MSSINSMSRAGRGREAVAEYNKQQAILETPVSNSEEAKAYNEVKNNKITYLDVFSAYNDELNGSVLLNLTTAIDNFYNTPTTNNLNTVSEEIRIANRFIKEASGVMEVCIASYPDNPELATEIDIYQSAVDCILGEIAQLAENMTGEEA
ncbi:hypothetical protein ACJEQI_23445 [Klebsiella variicola]|uniref:hypothetical protein n=1 Tax=Klebsiella variicola TaxID=244366 RepID=UPI003871A980